MEKAFNFNLIIKSAILTIGLFLLSISNFSFLSRFSCRINLNLIFVVVFLLGFLIEDSKLKWSKYDNIVLFSAITGGFFLDAASSSVFGIFTCSLLFSGLLIKYLSRAFGLQNLFSFFIAFLFSFLFFQFCLVFFEIVLTYIFQRELYFVFPNWWKILKEFLCGVIPIILFFLFFKIFRKS